MAPHNFAAAALNWGSARVRSAYWALLLAFLTLGADVAAAQSRANLVSYLEQQLGLNQRQARGALGAMLVFAQQRLGPDDFGQLAQRVPNAAQIMQDVKLQGIVTHPLEDVDDYEASLASLGIGQPLASQIAPAVLEYLGDTGHDSERDILSSILE